MFGKGNSSIGTQHYKSKNACSVKAIVIIIKLNYLICDDVFVCGATA